MSTPTSHSPPLTSLPPEEDSTLLDYTHNFLPDARLPKLILISHSHSPPLNPRPQLKFDVRSLPNPPKHIRDAYNGTSRRLQEWMLSDARFTDRRDEIKTDIDSAMVSMIQEFEKSHVLNHGVDKSEGTSRSKHLSHEKIQQPTSNAISASSSNEEDEESISSHETDDDGYEDEIALQVGIFCAMGRHRSVAMVEELSKFSWPGWDVKVDHRDISKKRSRGKKLSEEGSRGARGGAMSSQFDNEFE